jgi:hypothetical protein
LYSASSILSNEIITCNNSLFKLIETIIRRYSIIIADSRTVVGKDSTESKVEVHVSHMPKEGADYIVTLWESDGKLSQLFSSSMWKEEIISPSLLASLSNIDSQTTLYSVTNDIIESCMSYMTLLKGK